MRKFKHHFKFFLLLWLFIGLIKACMSVSAAALPDASLGEADPLEEATEIELNDLEIIESEEQEDVLDSTEIREVTEYNLELAQPIETFTVTPVPVYEVNPDDYNGSTISTFAMNGSVYNGSYNSTVITLWNGFLSNNIGKDYIAYRASQYEYYIWFGEDFEVSGNTFTGSGTYYCLNTYSSTYYLTTGSDSFTIDAGQNYLYTNVSADYPALADERGLLYEQMQTVMLFAILVFNVMRWVFIGR